jgi:hypothetical protein
MCSLKLQFPLPLPTRANRAAMPALCTAVLGVLAALQLALTSAVELPAQGWGGGGVRSALPAIGHVGIDPLLTRSPIFSPTRTAAAPDGQGALAPLGGAMVVGAITVSGRALAIVQHANGSVTRLPLGASLSGMRLVALGRDGATFATATGRLQVAFGSAPAAPAANEETEEPSE